MRMTVLTIHIIAACTAILSGFIALYAAKGATLHRTSGRLFVYAMVTMALLGASIAAIWGVAPATNIPVGLLTAYLVITALTTVRPPVAGSRSLAVGLMVVALGVALVMLACGIDVLNGGRRDGMPAFPFFMFGSIALLAGAGDVGVVRSGARTGGARLARHLWRMSAALLIASLSFSVQLPKYLPERLRMPALLALPMLAVLVTMIYWLWRVRSRRSSRSTVVTAHHPSFVMEAL
jgi:uncharacterized membrane protein